MGAKPLLRTLLTLGRLPWPATATNHNQSAYQLRCPRGKPLVAARQPALCPTPQTLNVRFGHGLGETSLVCRRRRAGGGVAIGWRTEVREARGEERSPARGT